MRFRTMKRTAILSFIGEIAKSTHVAPNDSLGRSAADKENTGIGNGFDFEFAGEISNGSASARQKMWRIHGSVNSDRHGNDALRNNSRSNSNCFVV